MAPFEGGARRGGHKAPEGFRGRGLGVRRLRVWDMGDCQNYGPFLGPYYNTGPNTGPNLGDPKRDHNFDNLPHRVQGCKNFCCT